MKQEFVKTWNASKQPRKQRKYRANAPLHLKGKFLSAHLSKELQTKYGKRSIRVKTGDKVKVLRGEFKGLEEKVEGVDTRKHRLFLPKAETTKRDGSKARKSIAVSNVIITDLNTADKKRQKKLQGTKNDKKSPKKA